MEFGLKYPKLLKEWHDISNHICILSVHDEQRLYEFAQKLKLKGIDFVEFREPDLGDCLTALALEPGENSRKICSSLSLAMKAPTDQTIFDREKKIRNLISKMSACPQTDTQSVLEHGLSVRNYALELYDYICNGGQLTKEWRLPKWLESYRNEFQEELLDRFTIEQYTTFHDCGKPSCLIYGEDGKKHFPNHAKISEQVFRDSFINEQVAKLIGMDMDIHLLKANGIEEFAKRSEAITLLLVGLAEIHSNAEMFGGMNSTSFKIKWKQIDRRGKQILNERFK